MPGTPVPSTIANSVNVTWDGAHDTYGGLALFRTNTGNTPAVTVTPGGILVFTDASRVYLNISTGPLTKPVGRTNLTTFGKDFPDRWVEISTTSPGSNEYGPQFSSSLGIYSDFVVGAAIRGTGVVGLPIARGGSPPLTYSVSPTLPDGITFVAPTPQNLQPTLTGTPTMATAEADYELTATDANGNDDVFVMRITVSAA